MSNVAKNILPSSLLILTVAFLSSCGGDQATKTVAQVLASLKTNEAVKLCLESPVNQNKELDYLSGARAKGEASRQWNANKFCTDFALSNSTFALAYKDASASKTKFQPQVQIWNTKAKAAGGGTIFDYFQAIATVNNIAHGPTSVGNAVGASCAPTVKSRWKDGAPSGWWSCLVHVLGRSTDRWSFEGAMGQDWAGSEDRGEAAGELLNWDIPPDFKKWAINQ